MKIHPFETSVQGSFKWQIILTFVVGFFVLAAAFAVYQVRTERAYLYRDSTDETMGMAESLATSSRSWVLAYDLNGMQEVVRSFKNHPEVRYAMIISPSGQVLAHTDATKVGQFVTDEASQALLKSQPANRTMIDDESISDIASPIMLDQRHIGWARVAKGREGIAGNLHSMILSSVLFVLTAVIFSLLAAQLIASRLGYRIGYLMRVAEAVQAGNYATRANISGVDEIARLANSLNHMLDVLAQEEEQLRVSSRYTRSLIEASLDPLVTISLEGKITDVNKATENVTGRNRSELIATDFSDYFTEPDKARQGYQQAFANGFVTDYPLALCHLDGRVTEVLYNASVYRDEEGEVLGVFAAARDVTERRRVENELLERDVHSQSLLRLSRKMERSQTYAEALNAAQDEVKKIMGYQSLWVYLFSDDKQFLKAIVAGGPVSDTVMSEEGTATLTIKGDRMLEEIAASKEIVLVEDARTDERVNQEIAARMAMRTIVNIPIMLFDRHLGCIGTGTFGDEGVKTPTRSQQKYLIAMASHMAVALDRIHLLSERKKAELALRELNNDFVTLLENTGDYIYFKDKDSRIRFCSQTLANITGHPSWRDMIGKHDLEIFPPDVAKVYYEEELPIFREGKTLLNKTDPYYDAQGQSGWVNTNKWPVFGDDKKSVVGIFGISRDITELKLAEDTIIELNRDLEQRVVERTEQLAVANKELEAFSYSVSHDLRTPLRAIDGFSQILLDDYTDKLDDEGKRLLNVVRDNTHRMGRLIEDILKFSRTSRLEMSCSKIDMQGVARAVYAELQPVGDNVQVEIAAMPPAMGDRALMHQVFVNLLSNAIKFSRAKSPAVIKVGGAINGAEAVYFVRDNGAGFDMKYAGKLFGVFQRLHAMSEFEGTGIGLAIVKRIVTRHGGRVWAEGAPNEGATIYFALPIRDALTESLSC